MDLAQFEDLLDRRGADLAAWPQKELLAVQVLLETSPAAQAMLAEMQLVETVLRAGRLGSSVDAEAIAARAMRHRQQAPVRVGPRRAGWAAAASIVLAVGFYLGGATLNRDEGPEHVVATALETSGPVDVE